VCVLSQLDQYKGQADKLLVQRDELQAKNIELEERLSATATSAADLQSVVGDLKTSLQLSERRAQEAADEVVRVNGCLSNLMNEMESLKMSKEAVQRDHDALKMRLEEIQGKGEEQVAVLQEERDMLRRQLEDLHHDLTRERTFSEGVESEEVISLRSALRDVTEERDVVRKQRDVQVNALAVELSTMKRELHSMMEDRDELIRQVRSFDARVQKEINTVLKAVEAERDGLKKQLEDMSEMSDYVATLKETIQSVEAEREALQKEVCDLKANGAIALAPAVDENVMGQEDSVVLPELQGGTLKSKAKAGLSKLYRFSSSMSDDLLTPPHKAEDGSRSSSLTSSPGLIATKKGTEWLEEKEVNPLPPFGLSSPVIEYLLHAW